MGRSVCHSHMSEVRIIYGWRYYFLSPDLFSQASCQALLEEVGSPAVLKPDRMSPLILDIILL